MADQTQPHAQEYFTDQQSSVPYKPAEQSMPPISSYGVPGQPFVAPAESFGSFGPLPGDTASIPANISPAAYVPLSSPDNINQPAPVYPAQNNLYTPGTPEVLPYPPYGIYPPLPTSAKTKKPLLFPLTRQASVLLQVFGMLLYSLVVALAIMGCVLILLKIAMANVSLYVNADNTINWLSIVITVALVLLLLPAASVFSGAFFGSWRGLIVALLSLAGGLLLTHLSESRFGSLQALQSTWALLLAPAVTALVVGFVYERRKYAAWWKSMFTMFLGAAILLLWFLAFIYIVNMRTGNFDVSAAAAHMTTDHFMAYMAIGFGCISLIVIPIMGLLFAGIEGIIHALLAGIRHKD